MLQGRILTSDHQEFVLAEWDGVNRSGYEPLDDKVLVLTDAHAETTRGGVIIPGPAAERQTAAVTSGVIIAVGPAAFRWNDEFTRNWEGKRPVPGDRIHFERYAGQLVDGRDGRQYRVMSQRCIGAVALPEVAAEG